MNSQASHPVSVIKTQARHVLPAELRPTTRNPLLKFNKKIDWSHSGKIFESKHIVGRAHGQNEKGFPLHSKTEEEITLATERSEPGQGRQVTEGERG